MKNLVREWVGKAEGDYFTARRERRARAHPNYDALCFHAQQCIENNQYAVEYRYPGESARRHEALEAFRILERLRAELRRELGLR